MHVGAVASVLGIVITAKIRTKASEQELTRPLSGIVDPVADTRRPALLMMPQTVTVTFMLVWLISHHGWSVAGRCLGIISQLLGALGRVAVGHWSDHVPRMRPRPP